MFLSYKKSKKFLFNMSRASRGFSLIEIMVVITLIALIGGIGTVFLRGTLNRGKIKTARTQAYKIAEALDLYKLQFNKYPSASEGLEALITPPQGEPIMEKIPKDPWGNEYNYANPGNRNTRGIDVWAIGPEEEEIGNWDEEG